MTRGEAAVSKCVRWLSRLGAGLALCAVAAGGAVALAGATTVTTHQTKRGTILAAANGHTLYLFSLDKPGKSACSGACASAWLPLLASGRPAAARRTRVSAKLLGTIKRSSRSFQVTYNGHPLYLFAGDKKPGEISGEGAHEFGGRWYIVNPAGKAVKPQSSGGGGNLCNPVCQGY